MVLVLLCTIFLTLGKSSEALHAEHLVLSSSTSHEAGKVQDLYVNENSVEPRRALAQSNTRTTTTHNSWGDRIKDSMAGFLIGVLLFIAAFPFITYNEGSYVHRLGVLDWVRTYLQQHGKNVEEPVTRGLVHAAGVAFSSDKSQSFPEFGVTVDNALRLRATVEMYQHYVEEKTEKRKDWVGGGETETRTETLKQRWSQVEELQNEQTDRSALLGGRNPPWPRSIGKTRLKQGSVYLAHYALSDSQIERLVEWREVDPPRRLDNLPIVLTEGTDYKEPMLSGRYIYFTTQGGSLAAPSVGDVRVSFDAVHSQEYTVVAGVDGKAGDYLALDTFEVTALGDYTMPVCCSCGILGDCFNMLGKKANDVDFIAPGHYNSDQAVRLMGKQNNFWLMVLRIVGFFMFFTAIYLMLDPVATLLDVVSFIGSLARVGIWLVSLVGGLVFFTVTTALAWLYYRPIKAVALIAITAGVVLLIKYLTAAHA